MNDESQPKEDWGLIGTKVETKSTKNNPPITPTKVDNNLCSLHWCENNHCWSPQLAIPHCQGCQNPLVAMRMTNCPICNEPAIKTNIRIDYMGGAHPITKVCKNEYHIGPEYIFAEINHKHNTWITKGETKTEGTAQRLAYGVTKLEEEDQAQ